MAAIIATMASVHEAEVVYGLSPKPGQVAVLTRSILGVMAQLSLQIDVPPDDVTRHRTLPTVGNVGPEQRPVVIIRSGAAAPAEVFTSVQYRRIWFWIAEDDFDSELAFSVLQILLAIARTEPARCDCDNSRWLNKKCRSEKPCSPPCRLW